MDENYTNAHRAFLQACIRLSVLSTKQTHDVLQSVQNKHGDSEAEVNDAAVRKMVDEINAKLTEHEIEQRLSFVHYEWDDIACEFLVFCNTFATIGASPVYNEAESNYMKTLMEKIVMNDTHSLSRMSAVHLSSAPSQLSQSQSTSKKVTKQRAEDLLEEWIEAGYFMNRGDLITLGPRGIGEYRDTFRTKFGDYIQCCRLCSEIALQPHFCPNDECDAALDKRCFKNYVVKQKKCPGCKSDWHEEEA
ncbi:non-structural maintenance of chromosomes element 1 homolog [Sitodiplosis mosellana]|uniref:non-structural maintenance of chromosomes element 1 homolog n=1 Tax=Sitodiplosis mosellana TaxID=263140 RepID=UPI002444448A|nr:non-structural maintenance of chromosomes element 1 homolog [Sitodiplosis mosellana]